MRYSNTNQMSTSSFYAKLAKKEKRKKWKEQKGKKGGVREFWEGAHLKRCQIIISAYQFKYSLNISYLHARCAPFFQPHLAPCSKFIVPYTIGQLISPHNLISYAYQHRANVTEEQWMSVCKRPPFTAFSIFALQHNNIYVITCNLK